MPNRNFRLEALLSLALLVPLAAAAGERDGIRHVLLVSVDGLHALDVANYIAAHPASALARLSKHGITYSNASCPSPSDSFPGLLALVTGGTPASHQVFYDVSYDRSLYDIGDTTCAGPRGIIPTFDESIDLLDSAGNDLDVIDPTKLPHALDAHGKCVAVYPHDFVKTNTVFEVVKVAGRRTAWADKHPAYDLVNGPSGKGVDDLYTPEITNPVGFDATTSVVCTAQNDALKVAAVVNQIHRKDHAGKWVGETPAVLGMNFQAVSVGQKLATDKTDLTRCDAVAGAKLVGKPGGYLDGRGTPTAVLAYGLDAVDASLGKMLQALESERLLESTLFIVTAKHGQAPIAPNKTNKVGGIETMVAALPDFATNPVAQAIAGAPGLSEDDVGLIWLADQDQTQAAADYLTAHAKELSIQNVLSGESLKARFNDPLTDSRTPDLVVIPEYGAIFTGSKKKNAEHGGFSFADTNVGLIVSNPRLAPRTVKSAVETTQVAPTILESLGLDPDALHSVVKEHTTVLPGLRELRQRE